MKEPVGATYDFKFVVPWAKKDILKFSFFQRTINDWNSLPKNVVNATSVDSLKSKLASSFQIFIDFLFQSFYCIFY